MKLYIAYGSNLNKRSMRMRCSTARPLGKFMLTDAKLVFRGVADVEYSLGDKVHCGLWGINQADERALDGYEGVDSGMYFKNEAIRLKFCGRKRSALIYLMKSEGVYPPSQGYVDVIRKGYQDFGLDESYLDKAVEEAFRGKDPDEQTTKRRARQKERHQRLVRMPESVAIERLEQLEEQRQQAVADAAEAAAEAAQWDTPDWNSNPDGTLH
jgi:hypothetical protein